jgi:hypothetical protein
MTAEQRAKVFHEMMLHSDVQGAVRYLTSNRETGGVLYPRETDEKSGKSVLKVLKSKHPDAKLPDMNKPCIPTWNFQISWI